jgi:hypothetical protein
VSRLERRGNGGGATALLGRRGEGAEKKTRLAPALIDGPGAVKELPVEK